jgi:hypothetical protein
MREKMQGARMRGINNFQIFKPIGHAGQLSRQGTFPENWGEINKE